MKHPETWLVIGSVIPLLLIFVLPLIGIRGGLVIFFTIVLVYGLHLVMIILASRAITRARERTRTVDRSQGRRL